MGYIRHDAIIVTGSRDRDIEIAHGAATACFAETAAEVTPITKAALNGQRSFLIAPDGSKEGWKDSDDGDDARARFISFLHKQEDIDVEWVEVNFGGDESDRISVRGSLDDEFRPAAESKD